MPSLLPMCSYGMTQRYDIAICAAGNRLHLPMLFCGPTKDRPSRNFDVFTANASATHIYNTSTRYFFYFGSIKFASFLIRIFARVATPFAAFPLPLGGPLTRQQLVGESLPNLLLLRILVLASSWHHFYGSQCARAKRIRSSQSHSARLKKDGGADSFALDCCGCGGRTKDWESRGSLLVFSWRRGLEAVVVG
jgi:hypothetical protein